MLEWHELDSGEIIFLDNGNEIARVNNRSELIELLDETNSIEILEAPIYAANGMPLVRKGDRFFYDMEITHEA